MAKVMWKVGGTGKKITDIILDIGCFLVGEMGEVVDACIALVCWISAAIFFIYRGYPYKTKVGFVAAVILIAVITILAAGILMIVLKILRYLISFFCLLFMPLNVVFRKLSDWGFNMYLKSSGGEPIKFETVNLNSGAATNIESDPNWKAKWEYQKQAYEGYIEHLKKEKEAAEFQYERMKTQNSRRTEGKTSSNTKSEERQANSAGKDTSYQEAISLYMLSGTYTKDELKRQRNRLLKSFHPDEGDPLTKKYAQRINTAYETLLRYADN